MKYICLDDLTKYFDFCRIFFNMHTLVCYTVEFFSFIFHCLWSCWVFEKVHLICTLLRNSRTPRVIEEQGRLNKLYISQGAVPPCFHCTTFQDHINFTGALPSDSTLSLFWKVHEKGKADEGGCRGHWGKMKCTKVDTVSWFPSHFSHLVLCTSGNMRCGMGKKVLGS